MPIYEYRALDVDQSCDVCRMAFEVLQGVNEEPLSVCPACGGTVKRLISWCRAAIVEENPEEAKVASAMKEYESAGMWSHAAELADKHSEKTGDQSLKSRALDDYRKAGYSLDSLKKS